jgi:hypothetical protein
MHWYQYLAYFFGGAFLANSLPHIGNGISGRPFQSPFAKPPGEGLSSSTVNVLWGFFNLILAYLLILRVGTFDLRNFAQVLASASGMLLMSVVHARGFGRFHGGR